MKNSAFLQKASRKEKNVKPYINEWMWFRDVSYGGWLLMLLTLLVVASVFRSMRIPVGGLQMHFYLLFLIPLFFHYAIPRNTLFPRKIIFALGLFIFLFYLSIALSVTSDSDYAFSEIFKIGSSLITIFTCALMVRTKLDFRVAVIGICLTAAILSLINILSPGSTFGGAAGEEAKLDVIANKNAFGLYVLPPLLFGSYVVLDYTTPKILRMMLLVCCLIITVAIFASGNRAGWIGALFIGVMLIGRGRSIKSLLLICILAAGTYYVLNNYVGTDTFDQRMQETSTQKASDDSRFNLVTESIDIALEYPVFGISPQELPYELGRRLPDSANLVKDAYVVDPHNLIAFIMAGSGFPCLLALAWLGWVLWRRPQNWREVQRYPTDTKGSHVLLRSILILWMIEGLFTREILYSPTFNMGLGLSIGFCISQGLWMYRAQNYQK